MLGSLIMALMATLQQVSVRWRSMATASARMAAVILMLVTMAVASRRMPGEAFGFWAICFAVMNFGMALDLGLRYGLANRMAALTAQPDSEGEQRDTFWAVFHAESLIGLVGFMLCLGILPCIDWAGLFSIHSLELAREVHWLFPLVCGLVMLNQPLMVAATVLFARQEIVFVSFLAIVQSVILVVVFGVALHWGTFPTVVLSFFGGYWLCGVGMTLVLMKRYGWRWYWTPWREQWAIVGSFIKPSLDFFVLSFSSMTAALIGPLVAGAAGGLVVAGDFTLVQRMFGFLVTLHLAFLAPLSPAYTYHARLGDWEWIRIKLRLCARIIWPFWFVMGGLVIWAGHPLVLRLWAGRWVSDYGLAGIMAVGVIVVGWWGTYSVVLNSLGVIRRQAVLSVVMLIPVIVLPVVLGRYWGIYGVAIASTVCALPGAILCAGWVRTALQHERLNV